MGDYFQLDDITLMKQAVDGNTLAFSEIVRRYEKMVAMTVKSMLGDTQQAEDVGQETFIRLYNSLNDFRGEAKLSTYIQRISINLSLNELKRNKRQLSLFRRNNDDEEIEIEVASDSRENDVDIKEVVSMALEKLDIDFRLVVTLRLIQGYSTKETADILDLPIGTVLSRLSRAKDQLKGILEKLL